MLKMKLFLVVFVFMASVLHAQTDLKVEGTTPGLYLVHSVVAKETWYSIGRLYNVSPKEIAPFNATVLDKPLSIGQQIKIPLVPANFSQDGSKAADEVLVPVHYTVQEKEWMYRISQNHNKIPVENLEKWNNIRNDQLKAGMKLVVGYLKVKPGQSALAASGTTKVIAATPAPVPVAKTETPKTEAPKPDAAKPDVAKEEVKKEEVKKETSPVPVKEETKPVVHDESKQQPEETHTSTNTSAGNTSNEAPVNYKGGYFKGQFKDAGKSTTGNAGIFRSTSGWKDGKYYALMNNVPVGTIAKVTFTSTGKTVYVKVLGQLPDMKESVGLTLRISDAAAAELGTTLGKFYVDVKW